jgi:Cd2+/Zn2+-exporting ATPase
MLQKFKDQQELIFAILCAICIAVGWMSRIARFEAVSIIFFVLDYLTGGFLKTKESVIALIKEKEFSVDILMMVAALAAAIIGYWEEGAMLIAIFAISGALETYTFNKSHKEISALMDLQPEEALLITDGREGKIVSVKDLVIGDVILIKPGDRVPADGRISVGATNLDEAAITGESIPLEKGVGDDVFAGTVNLRGSIEVTITKPSDETLFQKIINMVQHAQSEKSPSQLFIEKHEGVYVKGVLIVVALMLIVPPLMLDWSWNATIYRALVLLVVASPCALVASVTPAVLSAISNGARNGILFKGGVQLEKMGTLTAVAFDKTGTLTAGKPVVTDFVFRDGVDEAEILAIVAGIESHSTHPLADAIIKYVRGARNIELVSPKSIENVVGFGVVGVVHGKEYKVGKAELIGDSVTEFINELVVNIETAGKTLVYIGVESEPLGVIALKDTVREEAKVAIKGLHDLGIATIMITGDNEETAKVIAAEVGLTDYRASCLPESKVNVIKELQEKYGVVAMVGDGINDAPALVTADIGIAMGEGTDVALETADVVLMKNNLTRIAQAVTLSKRMNRIVKQNIVFAIGVISLMISSNFFFVLPIPLAVIAHEGNTILVILNGLRLLHLKKMH